MTSTTRWTAALLAALAMACSDAEGQSSTPAATPGALRARTTAGADLGYVYAVTPAWPFAIVGTSGASSANVVTVLLKEQPAGASEPQLVWRAMLTGSPQLCARYYADAGCTGTVTVSPTQAGSTCVSGGRMYAANFGATPGGFAYASAEFGRWSPSTLSFVYECADAPGTAPAFTLPAVDVGPAGASPGRIHFEPAD